MLQIEHIRMTSIWFDVRMRLPRNKIYCCIEQLIGDMVKEVETVFFFACLQFSSYDITVFKLHRTLPATSSERRAHKHTTDELVEDEKTVFFFACLQFSISDVNINVVNFHTIFSQVREEFISTELRNWCKIGNRFSSLLVLWYFIMMSVHCLQKQCYL